MEEYLDIVDENGNLTGEKELRSIVHEKGLWHQTVHIYFYRVILNEIELLVHLRSKFKSSHPNFWDTRFGGHVEAGQTVGEAVIREIAEEVGIKLDPSKLTKGMKLSHDGGNNKEVVEIYYYNFLGSKEDLSFDDGEVQEVKWMSVSEITKAIENENNWTSSVNGLNTIVSDLQQKL